MYLTLGRLEALVAYLLEIASIFGRKENGKAFFKKNNVSLYSAIRSISEVVFDDLSSTVFGKHPIFEELVPW